MSQANDKEQQKADRNVTVKQGMKVRGYFCRKLDTAVVVRFAVGKERGCTGTLHVSQFNGNTRAKRDGRFAAAKVGSKSRILWVIKVMPGNPLKPYTRVWLSERKPESLAIEESDESCESLREFHHPYIGVIEPVI